MNLSQPVPNEAKDDGGGGDWTTGAISRAKLQSNHHHQQTNMIIQYARYKNERALWRAAARGDIGTRARHQINIIFKYRVLQENRTKLCPW